jgi:hypothetical protein
VATLQGDRHLHVEYLSWSPRDRGESLESAHGTAWLGRSGDDSLTSITTGAGEGSPVDIPDAPRADLVSLWQRWPVAVRASWWRDGGRTRAQIRFGEEPPEQWARLGGAEVWAGSSAAGELRAILLGDVEVPPARFESTAHMGGARGEGTLELARSMRFDLYGLAGAVGVPDGFGSTYGIPSSLAITFGDRDAGDPWITVASTRDDHRIARWNALDRIGVDDVETASAAPWAVRDFAVDVTPARFDVFEVDERWVAVGRVGATTIWMAADRFPPTEVALERVDDLGPHVELRKARFAAAGWRPHSLDGPRLTAANVVHGLLEALDRNAGAPPIASAFTDRVAAAWGGRDRYERLLGLHTMLRPVCGHGGGGSPVAHDDGSIAVRISMQHAVPSDGSGTVSATFAVYAGESPEPASPPDPAAVRRGEQHEVELRLVQEDGAWRVDTDLLQILIDRLGSLEEVVRPLSEQLG